MEITIKSGSYSKQQLLDIYRKKISENEQDFDIWLSSMQKTNQIKETRPNMFETKKEEVISEKRLRRTIQPETTTMTRQEKIDGIHPFLWTYRRKHDPKTITVRRTRIKGRYYNVAYKQGKRGIYAQSLWSPKYTKDSFKDDLVRGPPRIGIRAGKEWTNNYGTPTRLRLNQIYKNGQWIKIEESPILNPRIPRYEQTVESYLSEIPSEIVQKYNLTGKEKMRVTITDRTKQYYAYLTLYGFNLESIIFFGETGKHTSDRNLELHGSNFMIEVNRNITDEIQKAGKHSIETIKEWLRNFDWTYYASFIEGQGPLIEEQITEGAQAIPLTQKTDDTTIIEFIDLTPSASGRFGGGQRTIGQGEGKIPQDWETYTPWDIASLIKVTFDNIGNAHGYKGRNTTYDEKRMHNTEGF